MFKSPLQAPYGWRHAALDDLQQFLENEAKAGRFEPMFTGGLNL